MKTTNLTPYFETTAMPVCDSPAVRASLAVTRGSSETISRWSFARHSQRASQKVSQWDRRDLVAKAREELLENPDAAGVVLGMARAAMCRLPAFQLRTRNESLNDWFESQWNRWCRATRMERLCLQACISMITDGEVFIQFAYDPTVQDFPVQPVLIDSQRIAQPLDIDETPWSFDGVEYNTWNKPSAYYVLSTPKRQSESWTSSDYVRVPASSIAHLYIPFLPEQRRGFSWLTQALETFGRISDYNDAVLENVKNNAAVLATVSSDYGVGEIRQMGQTPEPYYAGMGLPWLRNEILYLPPKSKFEAYTPGQPVSQHETFTNHEVARAGYGCGAPRYLALGSSADYNFASGKLDIGRFEDVTHGIHSEFELGVFDWLAQHMYASRWPEIIRNYPDAPLPGQEFCEFRFPPSKEIDSQKQAASDDIRLKNGTITRKELIERNGGNYESHVRQIHKETTDFGDFEVIGKSFGSPLESADPPNAAGNLSSTDSADLEELLQQKKEEGL